MTLYRKESALTYSTLFSKEGLLLFFWTTTTTPTSLWEAETAKIGESEEKRAKMAKAGGGSMLSAFLSLSLSLSLSLCIIQNELDLLCALSARILTLSFFLSLSLSLFDDDDDDRIERSGEIDPVQGVHAIVRVDFKPRGTEKTRGE